MICFLRHHSAASCAAYLGGDPGPWKLINTTFSSSMRVAAYITEYESKSTGVCEPRFGRLHSHVFPFVYRHVVRGDGRKAEKICELSCEVERSCPTVLVPSFDYNPSLPETPFLSPIQSCYLIKHEAINPQQHLYPNSNILKKYIYFPAKKLHVKAT